MVESKALQNFLDVELSQSTSKQYKYYLDRFLKWRGLTSYDELLGDALTCENHIIDYLRELKTKNLPRDSIELAIYPLFLFYSQNRIVLNERYITKKFPKTDHIGGSEPYSTDQIKAIIQALGKGRDSLTLRNKAIFYFISSTGCRLGAIPDVKLGDVQKIDNLYSVIIYKGTKDQYVSFLTNEASHYLDIYLNSAGTKLNQDSKLFNISYSALKGMIYRTVVKAGVRTKTDPNSKRYDTSMSHSFRKRTATLMKQAANYNDGHVEKLIGHKKNLDVSYNKPILEILRDEFVKSSDSLEIGSLG